MQTAVQGRVVTFYADNQTADVQICAEDVYDTVEKKQIMVKPQVLKGIPVHMPKGGIFRITFPVEPGDTCLLVFSQTGYDHWLYSDKDVAGQIEKEPAQHLYRHHNRNDAFCIVGFETLPRVLTDYNPEDLEVRNTTNTQVVRLKKNGDIELETSTGISLTSESITLNGTTTINGPTTINDTLDVTSLTSLSGGLDVTGGTKTDSLEIDGQDFDSHKHSGVSSGGSVTGGVV